MTGFFFDERAATSAFETRFSQGPRSGFGENLVLQGRAQAMADNAFSARFNLADAYDPIVAALNEGKSGRQRNWRAVVGNPYGRTLNDPLYGPEWRAYNAPEDIEAEVWRRVQARRAVDPAFLKDGPKDRRDLHDRVRRQVLDAVEAAEEAGARATPLGQVGGFLGRMGASIVDPPNVLTAFFGAPASASILRLAVVEGLIGAVTEAGIQVDVAAYRRRLGLDYTTEQFVANVATAGAGGVLLGGAAGAGIKLTPVAREAIERKFFKQRALGRALLEIVDEAAPEDVAIGLARLNRRQLVEAFDALVAEPSEEQVLAREALRTQTEVAEENPLADTPEGRAEHLRRLVETSDAVQHGEPPRLEDVPRAERRLQAPAEVDNLDSLVWRFEPEEIEVDAELFQFKGGGDAFGVTERLQGVTAWDPVKAGLVLVYEFRDGRRFIADGHQRVGLAKRIKARDPGRDVPLFGVLLREADGVTPEQARAIAAAKNIAEGTGTPIDAAKVLKTSPELLEGLPPRSGLVRTARALTELAPEAFGLVVNEIVPAPYAALVGRLAPLGGEVDQALQVALLAQLGRAEPANPVQAEAMVRQMLEVGGDRRRQATLFGDDVVFESLMQERARVLDRAIKQLRRERNVFSTLNREQDRIEAEGNQLAAERNTRRAERDGKALDLVQILANRRGGLSDDLTAAARRAREEKRLDGAVTDFVGAVRRRVDAGDFDGLLAGATGRDREAETRAGRGPESDESLDLRGPGAEQRSLEPFAEPAGDGQADQAELLAQEIAEDRAPTPAAVEGDGDLEDLARLADAGADPEILANHPAVQARLAAMAERPPTDQAEGFGTDEFEAARRFTFQDQEVIGYDAGIRALVDAARDYAAGGLRRERRADLVLGPPAAGKSAIAERLAAFRGSAIVDADDAKRALPEYEDGLGTMAVHEESSLLSSRVLAEVVEAGDNLVLPLVGANPETIQRRVELLKALDYSVNLHVMQVEPQESFRRMVQRFLTTGRLIAPDYVRSIGDKPSKTYISIRDKDLADGYAIHDNNVPKGADPLVLEERGLDPVGSLYGSRARGRPPSDRRPREGGEGPQEQGRGRVAPPEPPRDRTPQGAQGVIPGAERISDRALAERRGRQPLRGRGAQQEPDEGLFDVAGRGQADLLDLARNPDADLDFEVPVGRGFDDAGEEIATTRTARELLEDLEEDRAFLEQLNLCDPGGRT